VPELFYPDQDIAIRWYPSMIPFLARIARIRNGYGKNYLIYGRMLKPLPISIPQISIPYKKSWIGVGPWGTPLEEETGELPAPSILHSLWKAPNGTIGAIFLNIGDKPETIHLPIEPKKIFIDETQIEESSDTIILKPKEVALALIGNYSDKALETLYHLTEAKYSISKAINEQRIHGLDKANSLLEEALSSFSYGNYSHSIELALQTIKAAEEAKINQGGTFSDMAIFLFLAALIAIFITLGILKKFGIRKREIVVFPRIYKSFIRKVSLDRKVPIWFGIERDPQKYLREDLKRQIMLLLNLF